MKAQQTVDDFFMEALSKFEKCKAMTNGKSSDRINMRLSFVCGWQDAVLAMQRLNKKETEEQTP